MTIFDPSDSSTPRPLPDGWEKALAGLPEKFVAIWIGITTSSITRAGSPWLVPQYARKLYEQGFWSFGYYTLFERSFRLGYYPEPENSPYLFDDFVDDWCAVMPVHAAVYYHVERMWLDDAAAHFQSNFPNGQFDPLVFEAMWALDDQVVTQNVYYARMNAKRPEWAPTGTNPA